MVSGKKVSRRFKIHAHIAICGVDLVKMRKCSCFLFLTIRLRSTCPIPILAFLYSFLLFLLVIILSINLTQFIYPPISKKEIKPSSSSQNLAQDLKLAELGQDRETKERLEREKAEADEAERLRLEKLEEETQLERDRLAAMEAMEQQQREAERLRAEEEAKNAAMRAELEKKEMETKPVLTVFEFKALWSKLSTTGSFQCKLKELPGLIPLTNHLKKQGFHVVFAASPTSSDVEIGVCNIRRLGNEPWFMTRFLATPTSFSAVMKAEDATQVTAFVKKFALAKVLKIDGAIK